MPTQGKVWDNNLFFNILGESLPHEQYLGSAHMLLCRKQGGIVKIWSIPE